MENCDIAATIMKRLQEKYPQAGTELNWKNPWHLLVSTILATQCTDKRVNQVTPVFFSRWPTIQALAEADTSEVEKVIRSTGLYRNKSRNLVSTAQKLVNDFDAKVPSNMQALLTLPGVARKTANIVLSQGFSINSGIAVDTHVNRISNRLGLTHSQDQNKVERDLQAVFPRDHWGELNLLFVTFGREVCIARIPLCSGCLLRDICPTGKIRIAAGNTQSSTP